MQHQTTLSIPQPCSESWAAMTPTATGRHCAACARTVVDFTLKTDAEILAYLTKAAGSRTCGRFAAGQLERPLQRAAPAAPTARWRAWLAAAAAVWGLREVLSVAANAQTPIEMQRKVGKPVVMREPQARRKPDYEGPGSLRTVRGIVRDSATHEGLPGVSVLIRNTTTGIATDHTGAFELTLPADYADANGVTLRIAFIGYVTQERYLLASDESLPLEVVLRPDQQMLGEMVIAGGAHFRQPWPWHPRAFYNWTKYQLTRPFRR